MALAFNASLGLVGSLVLTNVNWGITIADLTGFWPTFLGIFFGALFAEVMALPLGVFLYVALMGTSGAARSTFNYLRLSHLPRVVNFRFVLSVVVVHAIPFMVGVWQDPESVISSFVYLYTFEGVFLGGFAILKLIKFERSDPEVRVESKEGEPATLHVPVGVVKLIYFLAVSVPYGLILLGVFIFLTASSLFPYVLGFWPLLVALGTMVWDFDYDYNRYYLQNEGYKTLPFRVIWRPLVARVVILLLITGLGAFSYLVASDTALWGMAVVVMLTKIVLELGERLRKREWVSDHTELLEPEPATPETVIPDAEDVDNPLQDTPAVGSDSGHVTPIYQSLTRVPVVYVHAIPRVWGHLLGSLFVFIGGLSAGVAFVWILSHDVSNGAEGLHSWIVPGMSLTVLISVGCGLPVMYLAYHISSALVRMDSSMSTSINGGLFIFLKSFAAFLVTTLGWAVVLGGAMYGLAIFNPLFAILSTILLIPVMVGLFVVNAGLVSAVTKHHTRFSGIMRANVRLVRAFPMVFVTRVLLWGVLFSVLIVVEVVTAPWHFPLIVGVATYPVLIPAVLIHLHDAYRDIEYLRGQS